MKENMHIEPMDIKDYETIYEMWNNIPGVGLSNADSEVAIERYLKHNPNLSFVYYESDKMVGTILCGHDGRRGYIHHTCVLPKYRGRNIGKVLVESALQGLKEQGIDKCHLFVFQDNVIGNNFWQNMGWEKREDIFMYSKNI